MEVLEGKDEIVIVTMKDCGVEIFVDAVLSFCRNVTSDIYTYKSVFSYGIRGQIKEFYRICHYKIPTCQFS